MSALRYLLFLFPLMVAAKPTISLERDSVFIGEPSTVVVTTPGSNADQPELFASEGLSLRFVDKQPQQLEDGAAALGWRFLLIANRAGSHQLRVPYGDLNAEEVFYVNQALEAKEPAASDDLKLDVSLSTNTCYVGQPIRLSVAWELWLPVQNVRAVDLRVPLLESADFRALAPHSENAGGSQTIGVPVSGSRVIADRRSLRKGDKRLTLITLERIIIPQKAGNFEIDPATLLCSVHQGAASRFQYPSYFNNDFFLSDEGAKHVRVFAKSAPLRLQVDALPPEAPDDFTGIVGTCAIELAAAVKEVDAGEPVLLRIRVTDYSILEAFELPRLAQLPAYANRFDCPANYVSGDVDSGTKNFERIIRPQRPEVREIPAIRFSIFNPATAAYEKITSNSLPLTVNPARTFTAYDADFSDDRQLKNRLQTNDAGITHNVFGPAVLSQRAPVTSPGLLPLLWLIVLLAPLVFAIALGIRSPWFAEFANPRRRAAKHALARVESLATGGNIAELAPAVRAFIAARYALLPNAHSLADVAAHSGLSSDELEPLAQLYADEAADRYGTADAGTCDGKAIVAVLRSLARQSWRSDSRAAAMLLGLLLTAAALTPATSRAETPEETLANAEATFNAALAAAMEDASESRELYRQAALHYQRLVADHDIHNAAVHLNLGNAWYLADEPGLAIVNYLRASRYQPDNPMVQQSLAHVRSQVSDEFPTSAWQQFTRTIQSAAAVLPPWLRLLLFTLVYAGFWRLLWLGARTGKRQPRALAATAIISIILLFSLTADNGTANRGVVVVAEVMPRKGNAFVYDGAFTTALHAGTEFTVVEQRGDWYHAEFANGDRAWLPAPTIQLVTPTN